VAQARTESTTKAATAAIRNLPSREDVLIPLYAANRMALEAMQGIINQPRVGNDASAAIQERMDTLDDEMNAIVAKLGRLSSVDSFWRDTYIETMVSHAFFVGKEVNGAMQALAKANAVLVVKNKTTH
jgi:hypothetical protein